MKNVSVKNWSILSLILLGASAVTAAVMPDKANKRFVDGTLLQNSATSPFIGGVWSCVPGGNGSCTASATVSTQASQVDSIVSGQQTENNTSLEALGIGVNSVLKP